MACRVLDRSMQSHGAIGFSQDHEMAWIYQFSLLWKISGQSPTSHFGLMLGQERVKFSMGQITHLSVFDKIFGNKRKFELLKTGLVSVVWHALVHGCGVMRCTERWQQGWIIGTHRFEWMVVEIKTHERNTSCCKKQLNLHQNEAQNDPFTQTDAFFKQREVGWILRKQFAPFSLLSLRDAWEAHLGNVPYLWKQHSTLKCGFTKFNKKTQIKERGRNTGHQTDSREVLQRKGYWNRRWQTGKITSLLFRDIIRTNLKWKAKKFLLVVLKVYAFRIVNLCDKVSSDKQWFLLPFLVIRRANTTRSFGIILSNKVHRRTITKTKKNKPKQFCDYRKGAIVQNFVWIYVRIS